MLIINFKIFHYFRITLDNIPTIYDLKEYVDETCIFQCLKTPMGQLSDEWWDEDLAAVEKFRKFISSAMIIHMVNILKCTADPHLHNTPALNEVKSLDHFTCHLQLPHIHLTNYANEINFNNTANSRFARGRGRGNRFIRGRR